MLPLNQSINATLPTIPQFTSWATSQPYIVFIIFIFALFLLYRLMRIALKGAIVTAAGFSFPYIVNYLGLPIPIAADIQTAINFAIIALILFILYEFSNFIFTLLRILTWPIRVIIRKNRYKSAIRKEVKSIEKRRGKT